MKYDLDPGTRAVLTAVIAGEGVECEYYVSGMETWVTVGEQNTTRLLYIAGKGFKLRLILRTIRIGEYDVPEPMREAPEKGARYYTVNLFKPADPPVLQWRGYENELTWLSAGLCHATKEGAIIHAKALLSLTRLQSCFRGQAND